MTTPAPYQKPTATTAGQPHITPAARAFLTEVEEALADAARPEKTIPTFYKDETEPPAIGTTPPVTQPGRTPMSQSATDASVLMIAGAGSVSMISVSAGILMYLSQYADPVVCGIVLGAPTVVVLALCRLVRRTKETIEAAPPVINHHYTGPVRQQHTSINNRGVWAKINNEQ